MAEFFNQFPKKEKCEADSLENQVYLNVDKFFDKLKNNLSENEQLPERVLIEKKENAWFAAIPVRNKEGETKRIYMFKNEFPDNPDKWEMTSFDDVPQLEKYIKQKTKDEVWN